MLDPGRPRTPGIGHGGVDGAGERGEVEAIADRAIDQIARWLEVPDLRDRIEVRRTIGPGDFHDDLAAWRGTALGPAHTLAQSALFRAGNTSTKVDGLLFAGGSTIPGHRAAHVPDQRGARGEAPPRGHDAGAAARAAGPAVTGLYLAALLVSIAGLVVLDLRWRLFLGAAPLRAAVVLVVGVAGFLAWDAAGVGTGHLLRGPQHLLIGVDLAPQIPIEELFFLILLCLSAMEAFTLAAALLHRVAPGGPRTVRRDHLPLLAAGVAVPLSVVALVVLGRAGRPRARAGADRRSSCWWRSPPSSTTSSSAPGSSRTTRRGSSACGSASRPIEDLSYCVVAALALPALWVLLGRGRRAR